MTPWFGMLLLLAGCPFFQNEGLVKQLDREIIALRQHVEELEKQGGGGELGQAPAIYAELVQVYAGREVKVSHEGQVVKVEFPVSTLFASTSAFRVRSEAAMLLDLLAMALKLHPEYGATIEGHTDDAPVKSTIRRYYPTNWELAAMRASAVARELVGTYAVPGASVVAASHGDQAPVADNDTPEGRLANQRIVVYIRLLPPASSTPSGGSP